MSELPPLPKTRTFDTYQGPQQAFTAEQMQAYAREARALAAPTAPTEPVAWAVYWGIGTMRKNSVHFERETAEQAAQQIKSVTEIRPLYATPPSAAQPEAVTARRMIRDGRTGCTAGTDQECKHPRCATACPALAAAPTTEATSSSDAEREPASIQPLREALELQGVPVGNMVDRHTAVERHLKAQTAWHRACTPEAIKWLLDRATKGGKL